MATTYPVTHRDVPLPVTGMVRKTAEIWAEWLKTRRTFRQLRNLDDRHLHDIGLNRADVGPSDHEIAQADHWWLRTMVDGSQPFRRDY